MKMLDAQLQPNGENPPQRKKKPAGLRPSG
jgi:hypothetical protein